MLFSLFSPAVNSILYAVLIVSVIGILAGAGLAIASYLLAVKDDPRAVEITECLPGANCGACGYSGCAGYANALAAGKESSVSLCAPGGSKVAKQIASIMGGEAGSLLPQCAQVMCQGDCNNKSDIFEYHGITSCAAMALVNRGSKSCDFGCLGFGDCVQACPFDAISVVDGLAVIHSDLCKGCKRCVAVCPQKIIKMFPRQEKKAAVYCMNCDKGMAAKKSCKTACITCGSCVRVCPVQAIEMDHNHAVIDTDKCIGCMSCVHKCPTKAILPQMLPVTVETEE